MSTLPPHPPAGISQDRRPRPRRWLAFFVVLTLLGLAAIIIPLVVNLRIQLRPEQITQARRLWQEHAPRDYDFEYLVQSDSSGVPAEDHYLVQVRAGRPVRVECNGQALPLNAARRRGVEGLYEEMERRLQEDRDRGERSYATATFDPRDGHPIRYVHRSRRTRERVEWTLKLTPQPAAATVPPPREKPG